VIFANPLTHVTNACQDLVSSMEPASNVKSMIVVPAIPMLVYVQLAFLTIPSTIISVSSVIFLSVWSVHQLEYVHNALMSLISTMLEMNVCFVTATVKFAQEIKYARPALSKVKDLTSLDNALVARFSFVRSAVNLTHVPTAWKDIHSSTTTICAHCAN